MESQWWYFFDLKFKSPSTLATSMDLAGRIDDAYEAAAVFNFRYSGIKNMTILGTEGSRLLLILQYRKALPEKVTAKELKVFSQYLAQDKQWDTFSNEQNKLFVPVRIIEMNWHEAQFAVRNEFGHAASDARAQEYESAYWPTWAEYDYDEDSTGEKVNHSAISLQVEEQISDEQMLAVIQSLMMTKDLGSIAAKASKQEAIEEVKRLIMPWAIYGGK